MTVAFVKRRAARTLAVLCLVATIVVPAVGSETTAQITPDQALSRLVAGNQRFVANKSTHPHEDLARRHDLAGSQHPFAVVLSCSDSRLPPELVFDQGLGDLFVIRVAGNITDAAVVGSIEYAVEHLKTPLILVLGHEKCGAVTAAMSGGAETRDHIQALVDAIAPVVAEAKKDPRDPLDAAVRLNVKKVVGELAGSEPILGHEAKEGRIRIVGAYYSLDTGAVTLLGSPTAVAHPVAH
jgi:carbonic anhydrase